MKAERRTLKKRFRQPDPSPVLRVICATIGPGKAHLLERIAESGSLRQTARRMNLTYRQAWLMLQEMNEVFQRPLVETFTGGPRGGGMRLTQTGRTVLRLYQQIYKRCATAAGPLLRKLHRLLKTAAPSR